MIVVCTTLLALTQLNQHFMPQSLWSFHQVDSKEQIESSAPQDLQKLQEISIYYYGSWLFVSFIALIFVVFSKCYFDKQNSNLPPNKTSCYSPECLVVFLRLLAIV